MTRFRFYISFVVVTGFLASPPIGHAVVSNQPILKLGSELTQELVPANLNDPNGPTKSIWTVNVSGPVPSLLETLDEFQFDTLVHTTSFVTTTSETFEIKTLSADRLQNAEIRYLNGYEPNPAVSPTFEDGVIRNISGRYSTDPKTMPPSGPEMVAIDFIDTSINANPVDFEVTVFSSTDIQGSSEPPDEFKLFDGQTFGPGHSGPVFPATVNSAAPNDSPGLLPPIEENILVPWMEVEVEQSSSTTTTATTTWKIFLDPNGVREFQIDMVYEKPRLTFRGIEFLNGFVQISTPEIDDQSGKIFNIHAQHRDPNGVSGRLLQVNFIDTLDDPNTIPFAAFFDGDGPFQQDDDFFILADGSREIFVPEFRTAQIPDFHTPEPSVGALLVWGILTVVGFAPYRTRSRLGTTRRRSPSKQGWPVLE